MTDTARVIHDCIGLLQQATALIGRTDDRAYNALLPASPRGSVAGHLRHVIEFYQCFLTGCVTGSVDYNQRARDLRIERDRNYAGEQSANVVARLREYSLANGERVLTVALEGTTAPTVSWSSSSVLRELEFLQSHTVHHYALIAMLLRLQGIEPGAEFGVAPSTLEYWARESACAA
jgi:uncharacterized damage-inducible protein DinB